MRRSSVCVKLLLDVHCSEEIGNVQLDALGSQKYYHFIRLMGRAASNIALECALQTRPNVCLISEEVEAKGLSLKQVNMCDIDGGILLRIYVLLSYIIQCAE